MKAKLSPMNARVKHERVDLGKEAIEKIIPHARRLSIIKLTRTGQILQRRAEYSNLHSKRPRSSRFAALQSTTSICPASNFASVSRNALSCHAGLGNASSSAATSPHNASMILIFSSDGSLRSSAMLMAENIAQALSPASDFPGLLIHPEGQPWHPHQRSAQR